MALLLIAIEHVEHRARSLLRVSNFCIFIDVARPIKMIARQPRKVPESRLDSKVQPRRTVYDYPGMASV